MSAAVKRAHMSALKERFRRKKVCISFFFLSKSFGECKCKSEVNGYDIRLSPPPPRPDSRPTGPAHSLSRPPRTTSTPSSCCFSFQFVSTFTFPFSLSPPLPSPSPSLFYPFLSYIFPFYSPALWNWNWGKRYTTYSFAKTPLKAAHAPLAAARGIQGILVVGLVVVVG